MSINSCSGATFREILDVKVNVRITGRERGKRVPKLCQEGHNIWVNLGRQYLAEVITAKDANYDAHYNDNPVRVMKWIGMGIGGKEQSANIAQLYPTLNDHYPGGNIFDDTVLTTATLERPVKVTGQAGKTASGTWMKVVASAFSGTPIHIVTYTAIFVETDIHLAGAYPAVPLSEAALMLSDQAGTLLSEDVYDYQTYPHIATTRQKIVAYNGFPTLTKTAAVSLQIDWELQF